jgi:hypothetical protein
MSVEQVLSSVGPNGKMIVDRLVELAIQPSDFLIIPTESGFHFCMNCDRGPVKVLQIWGALNQPMSQIIESRRQWFPTELELSADEERQIGFLLAKAGFKPTSGDHSNYRLEFGEREGRMPFTKDRVEKIVIAVQGISEIISTH